MDEGYRSRQLEMEGWYESLLGLGPGEAEQAFLKDYEPHAPYLSGLSGRVIDIGGGSGAAGRFLSSQVDHIVVEPAGMWRSAEWIGFSRRFRKTGPEPVFFDAEGEALPFGDGTFDAALAMWTLNHVRDPQRCIEEMVRVLKPGGKALVIVEDVPPGWYDLLIDTARRMTARMSGIRLEAGLPWPLAIAFKSKLTGDWPIQPDHVRLLEPELIHWFEKGMQVRRRRWLASALTYELVKN